MPITLVLGVGLDLSLSANRSLLTFSGIVSSEEGSIGEVDDPMMSDFDLVLLGLRWALKEKERLKCVMRASGLRIPVVCVADSSDRRLSFPSAALNNDPQLPLAGLNRMTARMARMPETHAPVYHCTR